MGDDIYTFLWELGPLYLLVLASYLFQVNVSMIELSITSFSFVMFKFFLFVTLIAFFINVNIENVWSY